MRTQWHKEHCVEQTIFLHVCNDRMVVGEIIRSSCDHNIQSGKIREVMPQLEPFTCTLVPLTGTLYQEFGSITMEPFTKKPNSAQLRSTPLSITAPAKGRQAALTTGQADTKLSCTQKIRLLSILLKISIKHKAWILVNVLLTHICCFR